MCITSIYMQHRVCPAHPTTCSCFRDGEKAALRHSSSRLVELERAHHTAHNHPLSQMHPSSWPSSRMSSPISSPNKFFQWISRLKTSHWATPPLHYLASSANPVLFEAAYPSRNISVHDYLILISYLVLICSLAALHSHILSAYCGQIYSNTRTTSGILYEELPRL